MSKLGKVLSINISNNKGTIKTPVKDGIFKENYGLIGDAHSGNWHRQVSLLGIESIEKMKLKDFDNLYGLFAENITTEGLVLYELEIGTKIKIGETIHQVTQIGKACHNSCDIKKQVGDCVMPREGIFTKVIKGGKVSIGDIIEILKG